MAGCMCDNNINWSHVYMQVNIMHMDMHVHDLLYHVHIMHMHNIYIYIYNYVDDIVFSHCMPICMHACTSTPCSTYMHAHDIDAPMHTHSHSHQGCRNTHTIVRGQKVLY